MPKFQKIGKLQYLFHGNGQGISCKEILVVKIFDPFGKFCNMENGNFYVSGANIESMSMEELAAAPLDISSRVCRVYNCFILSGYFERITSLINSILSFQGNHNSYLFIY